MKIRVSGIGHIKFSWIQELVYLVYSARTRGENLHVVESIGCPFKKGKPFFVALKLQLLVSIQ
jgi:hypothetical protein